jgi:hypothetical protein
MISCHQNPMGCGRHSAKPTHHHFKKQICETRPNAYDEEHTRLLRYFEAMNSKKDAYLPAL